MPNDKASIRMYMTMYISTDINCIVLTNGSSSLLT